MTERKNVWEKS